MSETPRTRVAFVGAGNIAGPYAASLARHGDLSLIGAFDVDASKRAAFAADNQCEAFETLDALVDAVPDIVVNLTGAPYHYSTTLELLERRIAVFSEKPLAMTHAEAETLVARADENAIPLACAPSLWLSASSQEAAHRILEGEIGTVRLVNAEVNQGRIETWHPAPDTFYDVGPVFDAGVYPLTYLTALFGPIATVTADSARLLVERRRLDGVSFTPGSPDSWWVLARFASGPVLRLTCTFYVDSATLPRTIDFHGDEGSLRLNDWILPDSPIQVATYGEPFATSPGDGPLSSIDWCIGLADFAAAIRDDRAHRTQAAHAAHVVEVLEAIARSAAEGEHVDVTSTFTSPFSRIAQLD